MTNKILYNYFGDIMKKKLFILSTKAGKGGFQAFRDKILKVYKDNNKLDEVEVVLTLHENHAVELAEEFIKEKPEEKIVISCGGDGTLGEIAHVLAGSKAALGLIPMGTGNDFSRNFDYSSFKIEDTFNPTIKPIDSIKVNNSTCINVCSLGFDTHVLEKTYEILEKEPQLGNKAFLKAVRKSILNLQFEDLEMDLNLVGGENIKISGQFLVSALCNGSYYGSGFNPSPNGKIDDGILNLIIADKLPLYKVLPLLVKYKFGKHLGHKNVHEYKVESGIIKSNKELTANLDGEIFYSPTLNFEIVKDSINWAYFK